MAVNRLFHQYRPKEVAKKQMQRQLQARPQTKSDETQIARQCIAEKDALTQPVGAKSGLFDFSDSPGRLVRNLKNYPNKTYGP